MARDTGMTDMGVALTAAIMRKEGLDCTCGEKLVITQPIERIPLMRQLRWAWFAHMHDAHPDEYAKIRFVNGRRRNFRKGVRVVDSRDIILVRGDEFEIHDIYREDVHAEPDSENYIIEAGCVACQEDGSPSCSRLELGLTREAAINLVANLMELFNRAGPSSSERYV